MISAILLECSFTTLIVFVVVLMVAWYSKYSLISLTFIAISRCINVSPVSAEPSITKMSIASSNLENSKTDNSSNLCNAASNHSFGIFSKTICNSDEQGILLLHPFWGIVMLCLTAFWIKNILISIARNLKLNSKKCENCCCDEINSHED